MKKGFILFFSIITFTILLPSGAFNQEESYPVVSLADSYKEIIAKQGDQIKEWQHEGYWLIRLTILVGLLGLVSGIAGALAGNNRFGKIIAVVVGCSITFVTLCIENLYKADYHTIKSAVFIGENILSELELDIKRLDQAEKVNNIEHIDYFETKIRNKIDNITKLGHLVINGEVESLVNYGFSEKNFESAFSAFVSTAYALEDPKGTVENLPGWITDPPTTQDYFYFLGKGTDPDIMKAEQKSYQNAVENAREYLQQLFRTADLADTDSMNTDHLIDSILKKSGQVARVYYLENSLTNEFDYYLLLKFNRMLLQVDVKQYSIREKFKSVIKEKNFLKRILEYQQTSDDVRFKEKKSEPIKETRDTGTQQQDEQKYNKDISSQEEKKTPEKENKDHQDGKNGNKH